jgi:hypothetical protein
MKERGRKMTVTIVKTRMAWLLVSFRMDMAWLSCFQNFRQLTYLRCGCGKGEGASWTYKILLVLRHLKKLGYIIELFPNILQSFRQCDQRECILGFRTCTEEGKTPFEDCPLLTEDGLDDCLGKFSMSHTGHRNCILKVASVKKLDSPGSAF